MRAIRRWSRPGASTRPCDGFFGVLVEDVIRTSRAVAADVRPQSVADVRLAGRPLVQFSPELWADLKVIRGFLFQRMYRAPSVVRMRARAALIVEGLFEGYMATPELLPEEWHEALSPASGAPTATARIVSDYLSGMTDRFATQEYQRLIGALPA